MRGTLKGLCQRHPYLFFFFSLGVSLTLFFHLMGFLHRDREITVELTLHCEGLGAEVCEALLREEVFYLDGRFPLYVSDSVLSPSTLRFYSAQQGGEIYVSSKKYSDLDLTLLAKATEHPFGMALGGVRTVNVGMHLSCYGEMAKLYGTCTCMRPVP